MKKVYDHLGREFPSLFAMASAWGVPCATLRARLHRGVPLGQALTSRPVKHVHVNGVNVVEYCRERGLNYGTVYGRLYRGATLEEALKTPAGEARPRRSRVPAVVKGVEYPSLRALARAYGINHALIARRLAAGMSLEEAVASGVRPYVTRPVYRGREFPSLLALCRELGISRQALHYRMARLSLEEAVDALVAKAKKKGAGYDA